MVTADQVLSPQREITAQACNQNDHHSPLQMVHFVHQITYSHLPYCKPNVFLFHNFNAKNRCTSFCCSWISLSPSFFQEHMELVGDTLRTHLLPSILIASPIPSHVRNYTCLQTLVNRPGKCTHKLKIISLI